MRVKVKVKVYVRDEIHLTTFFNAAHILHQNATILITIIRLDALPYKLLLTKATQRSSEFCSLEVLAWTMETWYVHAYLLTYFSSVTCLPLLTYF